MITVFIIDDHPLSYNLYGKSWQPKNYDGKYRGEISLRTAIAESINTVSVQLAMSAGLNNVVRAARRLGIISPLQESPSIALGSLEVTPLEMAGAYAHLAAGGKGVIPYGIVEIRRKKDNQLLYERENGGDYIVIAPDVVAMMNSLLSGVITSGTGKGAAFGFPAAGKTGTTSDYKDAWFVGYTGHYTTAVWVGNDDPSKMKKITGGSIPAKIWRGFMQVAHADKNSVDLPVNYGSMDVVLPWKQQDQSSADPFTDPAQQPANDNNQQQQDYQLKKSFWDKLFEEGEGQ